MKQDEAIKRQGYFVVKIRQGTKLVEENRDEYQIGPLDS